LKTEKLFQHKKSHSPSCPFFPKFKISKNISTKLRIYKISLFPQKSKKSKEVYFHNCYIHEKTKKNRLLICVIQRNSSENSSALGHDMSDQEYVLLDEIGEGAFGKVYKSRKESTQEILAAKVKVLQRV
jgi:hypothetical protein